MGLPFMSMGMSNDFEIAIGKFDHHPRGTSLFGKRSYTASKNNAKS